MSMGVNSQWLFTFSTLGPERRGFAPNEGLMLLRRSNLMWQVPSGPLIKVMLKLLCFEEFLL